MSAYKLGAKGVIPVKFQATCGGMLVDNATDAADNPMSLTLQKVGGSGAIVDAEGETPAAGSANTGSLFRFDDAADQYIYNLSIKSLSSTGVYSITISDGNGGSHTEWFSIK